MCQKFTPEQLHNMDDESKNDVIYQMQDRLDDLEKRYEALMEQIRLAKQDRYGRHTEKLSEVTPQQLQIFNEYEANCDEAAAEPTIPDVVMAEAVSTRKPKKKGKRAEDLSSYPQEEILHDVPKEKLDGLFGAGNYKSMPDEICWQLRYEPAKWVAEKHIVKVYVGTDGLHQDEFLRGDHPKTLYRGSIATPSLVAAILNAKYVNSMPLDRLARNFQVNGLDLSKQTISNWAVWVAERYLFVVYQMMKKLQLQAHVNQCDETPLEVIHDGRPAGSKSYMWVHLTGELSPGPKIIVYEYTKTRHTDHPREYYKDFKGVLVTDGAAQYHRLASELADLENANCMAHARRHYTNALKAAKGATPESVQSSIAYQALLQLGAIYKLDEKLKKLSPEKRLKERETSVRPLVEAYFAWVKEHFQQMTCAPKGETGKGLAYSLNQEDYLKVFLTDPEVPIDNSACERALRNFTIGRKNWVTINTIRGAQASAIIYSITETARANGLNVYYYLKYLLEELPDNLETLDEARLERLMPWSRTLPFQCYSKRRK